MPLLGMVSHPWASTCYGHGSTYLPNFKYLSLPTQILNTGIGYANSQHMVDNGNSLLKWA